MYHGEKTKLKVKQQIEANGKAMICIAEDMKAGRIDMHKGAEMVGKLAMNNNQLHIFNDCVLKPCPAWFM